MTSQRLTYRHYFRTISRIAVMCCLCVTSSVRAQNCSRNMLLISGPNSYVATPDVQALHLTKGFTIECWAKVNSPVRLSAIVDKGSASQYCYGIFLRTDSTLFGVVRRTNPIFENTPSIDSLQNWHHFAFVFKPGDSLRFYVDTVEVASQSISVSSIDSNTDSLRIGMSAAGNGFNGSIDELRIWNVPRSLASIRQTLFHTLAGNDSGLVLDYSFDDQASSPRVHDFSGHGRDGFVRGPYAEIVPSSSPIVNASRGYRLAALETHIIFPTLRCNSSFDTVVHVRNFGSTPLYVDTVGTSPGSPFSIVPNSPFTLPADSSRIDSLRLHFEPRAGGVYNDSLYISSSSDCGGVIRIELYAAYDSVGLSSSSDTINFGAITQCSFPVTRRITLRNTSVTDSVTILGVVAPPGSGLSVLALFPIHLAKSGSVQVTIQLASGPRGPLNATIAFDLDKCSRQFFLNVTAIREQVGLSLPAIVDFGTVPSDLAGVSHDTMIVVTNTGDVAAAINTLQTKPDSLFEVMDGRVGKVMLPGDTVQVHLRIRVSSCGLVTAKLNLESTRCTVDTSATLKIDITPPKPLTTLPLDMGTVCAAKDTTIYITNPNDRPVRLDTITYSSNLAFATQQLFPDTIAAHDSVLIQFRFNPALDGDYIDTAYLHSSPCGIGMSVFKGTWGFQGIAFTPPLLDFGRGCKTDSETKSVTLTNGSKHTVTLSGNTYTGSQRFQIAPVLLPLVLKPGVSKQFTITYVPTLGAFDVGTFTLLSPDNCTVVTLQIRGSREIATTAWSIPVGEFDTVCPGNSSEKSFDLIDKGIDSIDVMSATITGAAFTLVQSPATFGSNGHFIVRFTPGNEQDYSGHLTVNVDSCGTSFTLHLHGSGGPVPRIVLTDTAHDFGSLHTGDTVEYCIRITNPSCAPINLLADSSLLLGTPFKLIGMSGSVRIARGDTVQLCVQFIPATYGADSVSLILRADSAPPRTIVLHGLGLAPDVRFHPHLLDFGYVLHGNSKTLMVLDSNLGNLAAAIVASHNAVQDFSAPTSATLAPLTGDSIAVTFHPTPNTALIYDTLHLLWNGHADSVILRGFGTEKGLQLSAVGLDFGNVHVGHDSTLPLYLFATNNFPSIDSIIMQPGATAPRDTFSFSSNKILPYSIANDHDTLTVQVTYHARLEQFDTAYLVIHSGASSTTVPLIARGVEAHPWINPDSIPFPDIVIGTPSTFQPVQIKNVGDYPLYIDTIEVIGSAFAASSIAPTEPIQPGQARFDTVTFSPTRARQVTGTLRFKTSYHDSVLTVLLKGTGIYPLGSGPSFGYSVASRTEEPGQFDTIPVSMFGTKIGKIDADSAVLDIRFDSEMVRILGADAGSAAAPIARFVHLGESVVECTVLTSSFSADTILRLHTQALLGPRPLTHIQVKNSNPLANQPAAIDDGAFYVLDCGGPIHGVTFAGPYVTNAIVPNPAGDRASLQFELGLDGPVAVDVYNSIGQAVKHLDGGDAKAGAHSLTIDVSDLPQGRYVYRLKSLEYHAEGALIIMR